jgi:hypothetical protein
MDGIKMTDEIKSGQDKIEITFGFFIAGLMMEAVIAMGDMENPVTHKKEQNLQHAKIIIDTLEMLKEKTKNNLTKEESEAMGAVLYDLQMRFVVKSGKPDDTKKT